MSAARDAAFAAAIDANSADLLGYCERRLGVNGADALADAMLAAWRNVKKMPDDPEQARRWLYGMAHGAVLNARRGETRRSALADRLRAIRQEAFARLPEAEADDLLDPLSEEDAELVRLIAWEGFGVAEAGEILGLKPATARSRYARAKDAIRRHVTVEG